MDDYPHSVGDFTAIGPGCIASTPDPRPGTVINWRGAHFEYRPELPAADA